MRHQWFHVYSSGRIIDKFRIPWHARFPCCLPLFFSRTDVVGPPTTQIESSFRCPFKGRASVTQSSGDLFRKTSNCFLSRASAFVQSIAFFCRAEEFSSLRFFVIIVSVSLPHTHTHTHRRFI